MLDGAGIPVPCLADVAGGTVLFHGLGTAGGALIGATLKADGVGVVRAGALAVVMRGAPAEWPGEAEVRAAIGEAHARIAKELGLGAWHGKLPIGEQRAAVEAMCDVGAVRAAMAGATREAAPEGGVWAAVAAAR